MSGADRGDAHGGALQRRGPICLLQTIVAGGCSEPTLRLISIDES